MTEYRGQGTADASTATTTSILRETATATASQTAFNLSTINYTTGTNELSVFVDGLKKLLTTDYTETSNTIVTFGTPMSGGEVVEFVGILGGQVLDTTDATLSVFTHSISGSVQTTIAEVLDALALDIATDLKSTDGAEVQRAVTRGALTSNDGGGGIYYWDSTSTATDTSTTTGSVVKQNGVTTGRWLRLTTNTFTGDVTLDDNLIVNGTTQATSDTTGSIQTDGGLGVVKSAWIGQDLVLDEQADHVSTPAAGMGILWVSNTTPATLFFTDDAGTDFDISAAVAGGTITVADEATDTTCFPVFSTAATGAVSPKSNAALTYNSATNNFGSTTFTGALVGNASTATTAATVTTAAQPNITSLGTLTSLDVDNVQINGNTVSSTTGALNLTPTSGSALVLDATISVDAGVVTGATSVTSTNFVGAIDGVLGGVTPAAVSATTIGASGASTLAAVSATTVTASGIVSVDDVTQSTSTTTGSIHTDGGLGVAKDAFVGGTLTVTGDLLGGANQIGQVIMWPVATPPTGFLECDGSTVNRTTYAALFAIIGDLYGIGDGSTTFEIPDLRGQFVRGYDNGAGTDPDAASRTDAGDGATTGDNVGTKQADEFEAHTHTENSMAVSGGFDTNTAVQNSGGTGSTGSTGGSTETRPTNVALMYCIKYA